MDIGKLFSDLHPGFSESQINYLIDDLYKDLQIVNLNSIIKLEQFLNLSAKLQAKINNVCRSPVSITSKIIVDSMKSSMNNSNLKKSSISILERKKMDETKKCLSCRYPRFRYGTHSVTIDTTGRCVEPRIIAKHNLNKNPNTFTDEQKTEVLLRNYSMDFTFSIASIPSIFMDLIKGFFITENQRLANNNETGHDNGITGLMATPEKECLRFIKYLKILCDKLSDLLNKEEKLIKINAPAIVIGDLQGSLNTLFLLGRIFYQSFPILSENLIFLGNENIYLLIIYELQTKL